MNFSVQEVAGMLDLSAVQAEHGRDDIEKLIGLVKKYPIAVLYTLPGLLGLAKDLLGEHNKTLLGAPVGFPSGGDTTDDKVSQTKRLVNMGCGELDMVINVGKLRSSMFDDVLEDIQRVKSAASNVPLKVILECHHLTDDQIKDGCRLSIKAGADWIKTGTGWTPTGATPENIALIKSEVGNAIKVKASGGVRDLETLKHLYNLGARRFGVNLNSGENILKEAESS